MGVIGIPAGAAVIANVWALAHDVKTHGPNPELFNPGRHMNASQTAINPSMPSTYEGFEYGRGVCPGIHMAVQVRFGEVGCGGG